MPAKMKTAVAVMFLPCRRQPLVGQVEDADEQRDQDDPRQRDEVGRLSGMQLVQVPVDALRERPADALDLGDVVDRRGLHAAQAAEVPRSAPGGASRRCPGSRSASRWCAPCRAARGARRSRSGAPRRGSPGSGAARDATARAAACAPRPRGSAPPRRACAPGPLATPTTHTWCRPRSCRTAAATLTCPLPPSIRIRSGILPASAVTRS